MNNYCIIKTSFNISWKWKENKMIIHGSCHLSSESNLRHSNRWSEASI